jgi:hypothetical protein
MVSTKKSIKVIGRMLQENVGLTARDCLSIIINGKHVSETTLPTLKQLIIISLKREFFKRRRLSVFGCITK